MHTFIYLRLVFLGGKKEQNALDNYYICVKVPFIYEEIHMRFVATLAYVNLNIGAETTF